MNSFIRKVFHKFSIYNFNDITEERIQRITEYILFVEYNIYSKKLFEANDIYFDFEKYKYGYDKLYMRFSKDDESPAFIMTRDQIDMMIFNIMNCDVNTYITLNNIEKSSKKKWVKVNNNWKLENI